MGTRFWLGGLLALLVVFPARADYEETEMRLKTAGIDDELRERIHKAIDRGVEFLVSRQAADGGWPMREVSTYQHVGVAALCTLALRHAGTKQALVGFDRGMEYIFPADEEHGQKEIHESVYTAGIVDMILMADRSRPETGRFVAHEIANSYEPASGWWGYGILSGYAPESGKKPPVEAGKAWMIRNLSTTQFAALGMWAGDRLGARLPKRVWKNHLDALVRYQTPSGSWPYDPLDGRPVQLDGGELERNVPIADAVMHRGRPTCTFMGIANLLLAERAAEDLLRRDPALAARVKTARWKGLDALQRDGKLVLDKIREENWAGLDTYYTLYSLEKACIFAGVTKVDGELWYRRGAEWLCDTQQKDGNWGGVDGLARPGVFQTNADIDTAFALLFLLRASNAYTPRDPRPVDSAPWTPGKGERVAPARAPLLDGPEPVGRLEVELAFARRLLNQLSSRIGEEGSSNEHIETSLHRVDEAYRGLVPNLDESAGDGFDDRAAVWKEEAVTLVIEALTLVKIDVHTNTNSRLPVNVAAARILGGWDRDVSRHVMEAFAKRIFRLKRFRTDPALYEAGFAALAALGEPAAFNWLVEDVVGSRTSADPAARTLHALTALPAFEGVPGTARLAAVKRLVKTLAPVVRSELSYHEQLTETIREPLMDALRHLARDPESGRPPTLGRVQIETVPQFERWLEAHDDPKEPPWR